MIFFAVTQQIIMINGEDSESEKRDILLEFIQNMAPDDKAIIFFGKKAKVNI